MLTLYQFSPVWGVPSPGSFCVKLETYLRMAEIEYTVAQELDIRRAPKGKIPFIEFNGERIGDSELIIEELKAQHGDSVDAHLSSTQHAQVLAIKRLTEEHLYWALVYSRWLEADNWQQAKTALFSSLPLPLRWIVPGIVRRKIKSYLHGHGMGRHSRDEIYKMANDDITALSTLLAEQPFFMGEHPCSIDASIFGVIANIIWSPIESPLKQHTASMDNLVRYCERMRERYFPELCKTG